MVCRGAWEVVWCMEKKISLPHLFSFLKCSSLYYCFLKTLSVFRVKWLGFWFFICSFFVGNDRFADAEWRAEIHDPTGGKADKAEQSCHSVRKHH